MTAFLITFLAGIAVQATATFWVLSVDRGYVLLSTMSSMLYAVAMLAGIDGSLRSLLLRVAYVFGCGVGSLGVVWWSQGRRRRAVTRSKMILAPERRKNIRVER